MKISSFPKLIELKVIRANVIVYSVDVEGLELIKELIKIKENKDEK